MPARKKKVIFLLIIVGLFTVQAGVNRLLRARADHYHLAQRNLGNVDPTSGTAQVVLLGFRGLAVTMLWKQMWTYYDKQRWFDIPPLLSSINLLQPHFTRPWLLNSTLLSYNIASGWESLEDQYYWIRQGIDNAITAAENNKNRSDLIWQVGSLYHQRFGNGENRLEFRQMLRDEQQSDRPEDRAFAQANNGSYDSFDKAYDWYEKSAAVVRDQQRKPDMMSPILMMCQPAVAVSSRAGFLPFENVFGEKAVDAWRTSGEHWQKLGTSGGLEKGKDLWALLEVPKDQWEKLSPEVKVWVQKNKEQVDYDAWKQRCRFEANLKLQNVRGQFQKAKEAMGNGDYRQAKELFEKAIPPWRAFLKGSEFAANDPNVYGETASFESDYLLLMNRLEEKPIAPQPLTSVFLETDDE